MTYSLKNHYFSREFTEELADVVQAVYPPFDRERFIVLVHDDEWEARELKARMHHLTHCPHVEHLALERERLSIGEGLRFTFDLCVEGEVPSKVPS